jgi:hypothetical protein
MKSSKDSRIAGGLETQIMARSFIISLFSAFQILSGEICFGQQLQTGNKGTIALHVVDAYGGPVMRKDIREIRITNSAGAVISPSAGESKIANLPYGDYKIRVEVSGFNLWNGDVRLRTPVTRLTAGMQLGTFDGPKPTCSLQGEVRGIDRGSPSESWVRLLPSFANEIFEGDIAPDGTFTITGAECGKYVLTVIDGKSILHVEPVELTMQTGPLVVTINKK